MKSIYRWVPSLYLMEGLPFALVCLVSPVFYKNFHIGNDKIALVTSLFSLPWFFKPLFAPFLEKYSKQALVINMQFLMAVSVLLLIIGIKTPFFLVLSGIIFFSIAFFSSVHDINADGIYLLTLNSVEQANFIGIRSLCYQLGRLLAQSGIIFLVGVLVLYFSIQQAWELGLFLVFGFIFIFGFYHKKNLPNINQVSNQSLSVFSTSKIVLQELINLPNLWAIFLFTLFYNFSESQLMKIIPLFLLDSPELGGLGLSIKSVGIIYGVLGSSGVLCGIFFASRLLTKLPLTQLLLPLTLLAATSNIAYVGFQMLELKSAIGISIIIFITQFCYGLSNAAYMFFLLNVYNKGTYPMSLYAMGTSIMGLGMLIAGSFSGYLQTFLGYSYFFVWIVISNLLIVLITMLQKNYDGYSS